MQNRNIFYGRDIPKLFPKPEFWPEMSEIEPDEIYTIERYNYENRHISFQRCKWLKPKVNGGSQQNRNIFYGRDIKKLFPKPEFYTETNGGRED